MNRDEQEIRQLVVTWLEATKAGDVETVLGLMAEDVVFLIPGQAPMVGRAAFAAALPPAGRAAPQIDGRSDIQEVRVFGNVAYMWSKLTVCVTSPGGATMTRAGHTLTILEKRDGTWLLVRDANMLVPV